MSQKVGISVPILHALSLEAQKNEVDLDGLNVGLRRFASYASDAAAGSAAAKDKFAAIGVDAIDPLTKKIKPMPQLLQEVAAKFAGWDASTQKTAISIDFFGRSGSKLIPILNSIGVDGFDPLMAKAIEFGGVLSQEDTKAAEDFQHLTIDLKKGLSSLAMGFTQALLPSLKDSAQGMASFARYISDVKQTMKEWMPVIIDVSKALLSVVVVANMGPALALVGSAFSSLSYMIVNAGWAVKNLGFLIQYFAQTTLGAMLLNPLTLVAAAIGGIVYLWSQENRALRESKQRMEDYTASIKGLTQAQLDNYKQQLKLYLLEIDRQELALREKLPSGEAASGGFQPDIQGSPFDAGLAKRLEVIIRYKTEATKLLDAVDAQIAVPVKKKVDAPTMFAGVDAAVDKMTSKLSELRSSVAKVDSPMEAGRQAIENFITETVKDIPLDKYPKLKVSVEAVRSAYEDLTDAQETQAMAEASVVDEAAASDARIAASALSLQKLTYAYEDGKVSVSDYYNNVRASINVASNEQLADIERRKSLLKDEGDDLKKKAELDRDAAKIKVDTTAKTVEENRKEELSLRNLVVSYADARAKIAALQEKATPGGTEGKVQARYDADLAALEANHAKEMESYQRMTDAQLEAATGLNDRLTALDSIRAVQKDERAVLENEQSLKRFDDLMAEASAYGNVQLAVETLIGKEGERQANLLNQQAEIQLYQQVWKDANEGIWQSVSALYESMKAGLSSIFYGIMTGSLNAMAVLRTLGQAMLKILADYMAKKLMAFLFEKSLMAAQVASATAAAVAIAAALAPIQAEIAAAWAPAAISASIATFGVAAGEGLSAYIASLMAGVATAQAVQAGSMVGVAHAGLTYVPEERTYLLNAGERVLAPQQNTDLTEFLAAQGKSGGAGGDVSMAFYLDSEPFFKVIEKGVRDGRLKAFKLVPV
jgi:hypothetical protein